MSEQPGLTSLGEYFPGTVPRLVASLWKPVLERAFHVEVRNHDGHLFADGQLSLRSPMLPEPDSALAAARYWREKVEPELDRQVTAMRVADLADPESAARELMRRWLCFYHWYFLNPAAAWVERARSMADGRPELAGRGTRVRKRQRLLAEIAALRGRGNAESPAASRLFGEYLDEFGAYSAHPETLVGPYPRDDPSLVERELALIGRRPPAGDANSPGFLGDGYAANSTAGLMALLAIAEDDNHYKYEACYAAHKSIHGIGEMLARAGRMPVPGEVWNWSIDELIGHADTSHTATPAGHAALGPAQRRRRGRDGHFTVFGQQVVDGTATGLAWMISGDADPPDGDVILVTEGLGSIQAGSLLPYARGLVARNGGPTSHCALIAREVNRPVVVVGDDIDALHDGDWLTLQADGMVVVDPRPDGDRPDA